MLADARERQQKAEQRQAGDSLHHVGKTQHPPAQGRSSGEQYPKRNPNRERERHGDQHQHGMLGGEIDDVLQETVARHKQFTGHGWTRIHTDAYLCPSVFIRGSKFSTSRNARVSGACDLKNSSGVAKISSLPRSSTAMRVLSRSASPTS